MPERLLRLRVAGKRLGDISAKTVRRWIERGRLHGVRLSNGHWRIPESEVTRCAINNLPKK